MRAGESDLDAVRRELGEELGLAVTGVGRTLGRAGDPGSPYVVEFVETEAVGEPRALEHDELRWVLPADLGALRLAPSDARFVAEVLAPS